MKRLSLQYIKKNNKIAIIIGIGVLMWVTFKILFPSFYISNKNADHFAVRNIVGQKYLELKIKNGYPFHRIIAKINGIKNVAKINKSLLGKVYQDKITLYSQAGEIKNIIDLEIFLNNDNSQLQNGELIQKGNSVYLITDGQYRAFANAEVFDELGFDWSKVIKNKDDLLDTLEKGKNITRSVDYLSGMFVEVGKDLHLIHNNSKYKINTKNKSLVKFIKNKFSIIVVDKNKLKPVGKMQCTLKKENAKCYFKDTKKNVLPGAKIIIEINNQLEFKKMNIFITTFDKLASVVPKITLRNIKGVLISRYSKRFGYE